VDGGLLLREKAKIRFAALPKDVRRACSLVTTQHFLFDGGQKH
jgi:hypothetical protein